MPVYVALLRAINVAGTGVLPMAELRAVCERIGFGNVQTYVQSGNVVFRSDEPEGVVQRLLEEALAEIMGKAPGVMLRSRAQLQAVIDALPFPQAQPNQMLITFLPEAAPADATDTLVAPDGEEVRVGASEIYVHYPNGVGRSRLKLPALKAGTARNLNTVRKLAEIAAGIEAGAP